MLKSGISSCSGSVVRREKTDRVLAINKKRVEIVIIYYSMTIMILSEIAWLIDGLKEVLKEGIVV